MTKSHYLLLALSLATGPLALSLSSCSWTEKTSVKAAPIKVLTVGVAKATKEEISRELELAAEFHSYQEIAVHAKVAGFLKQINVDVGDRVRVGQLLALLEIPELNQDLDQALAVKKRSEAQVNQARGDLARAEASYSAVHLTYTRLASVIKLRPNLLAQQEIDDALSHDLSAEAQISAAKAALAAAEEQVQAARAGEERVRTLLAYSRITAPFSGVVTKRFADTGAMIQAGTASQTQAMPLITLSQNDRLRLVLPVPESVVPRIHLGGSVRVRVPSLGKTFEGIVARFAGKVEAYTRTMETEVDVPNPELILMPGMYAYAQLILDQRNDALTIPIQALSSQDEKHTVFLVNPEKKLERREVEMGIESPTKVEILSGLKENDLVVIGGRSQLKPGDAVEPKIIDLSDTKGAQ